MFEINEIDAHSDSICTAEWSSGKPDEIYFGDAPDSKDRRDCELAAKYEMKQGNLIYRACEQHHPALVKLASELKNG